MTSTVAPDDSSLWRTAAGGRAHLARCSHLLRKAVIPATDQPVCDSCQAELDGHGRDYQVDLTTALPAMGVSGSDWATVQALVGTVDHDLVWLPYSRSYIALGLGGRAVAWVGKNYVDIAGRGRTELPGYAAVQKSGGASREVRYGQLCPVCNVAKSLSGACDCS